MGLVKLQESYAVEFRITFPFLIMCIFGLFSNLPLLGTLVKIKLSPIGGWNAELEAGKSLEELVLICAFRGPQHRPQCFQSQEFLAGISLVLAIRLWSTKLPLWLLATLRASGSAFSPSP